MYKLVMKKYLLVIAALIATKAPAQMHHEHINIFTPPYYKYEMHERKNISLLTGYSFGRDDYAELGLARASIKRVRNSERYNAFFVSGEVRVRQTLVVAPKIGCWVGNGLGAGINAIYYTDLKNEDAIRLRPEVGLAYGGLKLVYGYNIPVTNASFTGVSKHVLSLVVLSRLKQIGEEKREADWDPEGRRKYETRRQDTGYSKYNFALLAGAHGFTDVFGEVSFGFYADGRRESYSRISGVGFVGTEFKLTDQTIIAPKAGIYMRGSKKVSMGFGTSMLYYIGMRHSSLALRPEIGMNIGLLRLTYGYNHIITNYRYPSVSQHNFSVVMVLKLGKGKTGDNRLRKDSSKNF